MAWFGGKSTHKKEFDAAYKVLRNLFEKTIYGGMDAPLVLRFKRPDSRFRYFVFCLSTVQVACERRMKNPDAVVKDLLHTILTEALKTNPQLFWGGPVDPQVAAAEATGDLDAFLTGWTAYMRFRDRGTADSGTAATLLLCSILSTIETDTDPADDDTERLWPLAVWIEQRLADMDEAFASMAR